MDNVFSFLVVINIMRNDNNLEPQSVEEFQHKNKNKNKNKKRLKWKKTIQVELDLLEKQEVFKSIAQTPKVVNPIRYK